MEIKEGVRLGRLHPEMLLAWLVAEAVWRGEGKECVVTAGLDGVHSARSKHYIGCALDLRTRYFSGQQVLRVAEKLRAHLGLDYDVVVESTHIHVEYDPKEA